MEVTGCVLYLSLFLFNPVLFFGIAPVEHPFSNDFTKSWTDTGRGFFNNLSSSLVVIFNKLTFISVQIVFERLELLFLLTRELLSAQNESLCRVESSREPNCFKIGFTSQSVSLEEMYLKERVSLPSWPVSRASRSDELFVNFKIETGRGFSSGSSVSVLDFFFRIGFGVSEKSL